MTKTLIFIAFFCTLTFPSLANSRPLDSLKQGVNFERGLSWEQILAKAKLERKYIFVDCYTTWCAPCKRMEMEVYSRKDVGNDLNQKYLSVKAQLDTSKSDNAETRAFYADAHYIGSKYNIQLYPTLLFFTPDGNILGKVSGGMEASDFIKLVKYMLEPKNDYYSLLKRYKDGERNLDEMSYLARTALSLLNDTVQSKEIAREYVRILPKDQWLSIANIQFAHEFTHHSKDSGFGIFYENADSIDRIMKSENYAEEFVNGIIYDELIKPEIIKCRQAKEIPNWARLCSIVASKYNNYYAKRVVLGAKLDWNYSTHNYSEYTRDLVDFVEKYAPKSDSGGRLEALYFNNCAWDIFEYSSDSSNLTAALRWSLRAISIDPIPDWMDTYANILYKIGRKGDALKWEDLAVKLAPNYKPIISNYQAMKAGKPTWTLN